MAPLKKIILTALFAVLTLVSGCAVLTPDRGVPPGEESTGLESFALKPDFKAYKAYIEENIAIRNAVYAKVYAPCNYLVETELGVKPLQHLIDEQAAAVIADSFMGTTRSHSREVDRAVQYINDEFEYIPMPELWPSLDSTLKTAKGDCKGFSLLLMSILKALRIEHYGAISNGHMWVNARVEGRWIVLETDRDPERNQIYQLAGFYKDPLFKIYPDRSQKRVKKKQAQSQN